MKYRVIFGPEIVRREHEFRRLTEDVADSDMNRLLDALLRGSNSLILATVAEENSEACGWATCETFMGHILMGVFVHPDYRLHGMGSALVELLVQEVKKQRPAARLEAATALKPFWRQFPDIRMVTRY